MSDPSAPERSSVGRKAYVETVVDDVFGFDFKLPRTLRDSILRPGRVADASLAHDRSLYMRPLRMFLLISGVQLLVSGWLGFNDTGTFSVLLADNPAALANVEARLAAVGTSLAEADEIVRNWTIWTTWPLVAVSSFLYAFVMWATRPRLGLINAGLLYLIASNGSILVSLPLTLISGLLGPEMMALAAAVGFIVLFVYLGLVLHRRAADTAFGLAMRIVAIVLTTVPVLLIGGGLVFGMIELAFYAQTGVSRIGLLGPGPGG